MYVIQPHYHGIARTAQDYERMAMSGVVAVAEPAFWAGFDREYPETFLDIFHNNPCRFLGQNPKWDIAPVHLAD